MNDLHPVKRATSSKRRTVSFGRVIAHLNCVRNFAPNNATWVQSLTDEIQAPHRPGRRGELIGVDAHALEHRDEEVR